MDFQNLLTPASFTLFSTAQISQCVLLRNNGVGKGKSEESGSMMQSCPWLGFSAHFPSINEVQYFEQVTRRGYFYQTLGSPVSKQSIPPVHLWKKVFLKLLKLGIFWIFWEKGAGFPSALSFCCWWNFGKRWIRDRWNCRDLHIPGSFLWGPKVPS